MAALRKIVTEHLKKQITEQAVQKLVEEWPDIAVANPEADKHIVLTGARAKLLAALSGPTDGSRRNP